MVQVTTTLFSYYKVINSWKNRRIKLVYVYLDLLKRSKYASGQLAHYRE